MISETQRLIYEQVQRIVDTFLDDVPHQLTVAPALCEEGQEAYVCYVRWHDGEIRRGITQTLYTCTISPRDTGLKDWIENWALYYFAREIGLWKARKDGIV